MGQNFAGVVRLKVKRAGRNKNNLRLGEDIFKDGRLNFMTSVITQIKKGRNKGRTRAPLTAWQEDGYTLKEVKWKHGRPGLRFMVFVM
jgi:alpha-L-rhamnosidase